MRTLCATVAPPQLPVQRQRGCIVVMNAVVSKPLCASVWMSESLNEIYNIKWRTKWHDTGCVCRWCVYLNGWRRSEGDSGESPPPPPPFPPPWRLHRCFRLVRKTSPPPQLPPKDQSNMESSLCWGKTFTKELLQLWSKLLKHQDGALNVLLLLAL